MRTWQACLYRFMMMKRGQVNLWLLISGLGESLLGILFLLRMNRYELGMTRKPISGIGSWATTEGHRYPGENQLRTVKNQYSQFSRVTTREVLPEDFEGIATLEDFIDDSLFRQLSVGEQVAKLLLKWYNAMLMIIQS